MPENTETSASSVPQSRWLNGILLSVYHIFDQRACGRTRYRFKSHGPTGIIRSDGSNGEEGLARRTAIVWVHGDTVTVEHEETPLAQYTARISTRQETYQEHSRGTEI